MPSRDRLADNEFRGVLIAGLEQALRECEVLKVLRNRRQQERMNERLKDDRPLTDVLQSLIKSSPNLTMLLQLGQRISAPFNTVPAAADEDEQFKGEVYPTFFKIKGVDYGKPYRRGCPVNQRMRLTFETDARNDYFIRPFERGQFSLRWIDTNRKAEVEVSYIGPNLKNGIAVVTANLPDEVQVGDQIELVARVTDSRGAFENRAFVTVMPEVQSPTGGSGTRKPPGKKDGEGRERPTQVAPPQIKRVYRVDWEHQGFDEFTAMKAEPVGYSDDESTEIYEFKVNMDNTPLLNEIKQRRLNETLARNQFLYANVLVGLSLLLEEKKTREPKASNGDEGGNIDRIEDRIEKTCRAIAPFVLALTSLGTAELGETEEIEGLEEAG